MRVISLPRQEPPPKLHGAGAMGSTGPRPQQLGRKAIGTPHTTNDLRMPATWPLLQPRKQTRSGPAPPPQLCHSPGGAPQGSGSPFPRGRRGQGPLRTSSISKKAKGLKPVSLVTSGSCERREPSVCRHAPTLGLPREPAVASPGTFSELGVRHNTPAPSLRKAAHRSGAGGMSEVTQALLS